MTGFERIGGTPAVSALRPATGGGDAATVARTTLASVGERVLAWTAASFGASGAQGQWSARTGVSDSGFVPSRTELARGGDVYQLRSLTREVAGQLGASPAQEGALGRAIEDFARATALHFNARAGGDNSIDDVAAMVDTATAAGSGGIDGVTARIETAARGVEALNQ